MISAGTLTRIWWVLGYLLVIAAAIVCLVPGQELPSSFELNDKLSHIIGHAGLAIWFAGLMAQKSWWKIFLWLLALGTAIEFAQYFMHAGREGDPRDVVANSCGALAGLAFAWLGLSHWPRWASWVLGQRQIAG